MTMTANSSTTKQLLAHVSVGESQALAELFARHKERLRKMVRLRLDRRLRGHFSSSAVLDDVFRVAAQRMDEYLADPSQPFFLWLRLLTGQTIQAIHQKHGAQCEEGEQEVSLFRGALPEANSVSLAAQLLGHMTDAGQAAARAEMQIRLQEAINSMDATDREVLTLCHFEELTHEEAAAVLGLDKATATRHYLRAFKRLKDILNSIPGFIKNPRA
jgi:RNA polymerase sigma-70 factor (ECF subfamily)